jgi:crossover junction endodeoxyribonuclease RuvC
MEAEMIHFGIDVGVTGAIAALDDDAQLLALADLETTRYGKFAWTEPLSTLRFIRENSDGRPSRAWVEYVAPMPKLGVIASAGMGRTHGSILAALQVAGIPFEMVAPQAWKRRLNVTSDKGSTLDMARIKFPGAEYFERKKDHNRAEAALIAYFGRMTWSGEQAANKAMAEGRAPF